MPTNTDDRQPTGHVSLFDKPSPDDMADVVCAACAITACPACGYDLRGSPAPAQCPECGLANPPEAVAVGPYASRNRDALMFLLPMGLVGYIVCQAWIDLEYPIDTAFVLLAAAFGLICIAITFLPYWWQSRKYFVFDENGIVVGRRGGASRRLAWDDIRDVVNRLTGVRVKTFGNSKGFRIPIKSLPRGIPAAFLVEYLLREIQRRRPDAPN